jgi:hypothetical protein
MFGFLKKMFGGKPAEQTAEAPYKVETTVVETPKVEAPAPVVEAAPVAKPAPKKKAAPKKAAPKPAGAPKGRSRKPKSKP